MPHATLKMDGKEFVLVPKAEYRQFKDRAARTRSTRKAARPASAKHEAGDISEAKRRLAAGNFKPYAELRKELGL